MNPLVLYHSGCVDGFASAWAAYRHFGDKAEYRAVKYGDDPPGDDLHGREVYILDFSYLPEFIDVMATQADNLTLLDHHETAIGRFRGAWGSAGRSCEPLPFLVWKPSGKATVLVHLEQSGAQLAWDYFHYGQARPWFIDYVADRDLWQWKLVNSLEINAYLGSLPFDFAAWDKQEFTREKLLASDANRYCDLGGAILQKQERQIESAVKRARTITWGRRSIGMATVDFDGNPIDPTEAFVSYTSPVINLTENISEVLNRLCAEPPHWAIGWFQDENGRYRYSLRSSPQGPDVAKIAETFGGGGHVRAAGFESDRLVF
jgi:oligoribonuclease NrnB/cAMP/cGMP phosphodiesterase (DHH superfamily)